MSGLSPERRLLWQRPCCWDIMAPTLQDSHMIFHVWSTSVVMFVTKLTRKLSSYVSLLPDPMAWKEDDFQRLWDKLNIFGFASFAVIRSILNRVHLSSDFRITLLVPMCPRWKLFPYYLSLRMVEPKEIPSC